MKIEKKTFYSFNDDNGEGFKQLQEFSKTIKKKTLLVLSKIQITVWDLINGIYSIGLMKSK